MRGNAAHILHLGCWPKGVEQCRVKQTVELLAGQPVFEPQSISQLKRHILCGW